MKKLLLTLTAGMMAEAALPVSRAAAGFATNDPYGWMMSVIAMSVVFFGLVVLFLSFKYLYPLCAWCGLQLMKSLHRKKQYEQITERRSATKDGFSVSDASTGKTVDDEALVAAIALSMHLHQGGGHDVESGVLTLEPHASAWTGAGQNQLRKPLRRF